MPETCHEEKNRFHHINSSYDDSSQLSSIIKSSHGNKSDLNSIGDSIESINSAKLVESARHNKQYEDHDSIVNDDEKMIEKKHNFERKYESRKQKETQKSFMKGTNMRSKIF